MPDPETKKAEQKHGKTQGREPDRYRSLSQPITIPLMTGDELKRAALEGVVRGGQLNVPEGALIPGPRQATQTKCTPCHTSGMKPADKR